MRKLGLCRRAAVIRKTLFRVIPAGEHGEIGTRDAEEAAVGDGLDGGIDKGCRGAVRVKVDHLDAVGFGAVGVYEGAAGGRAGGRWVSGNEGPRAEGGRTLRHLR